MDKTAPDSYQYCDYVSWGLVAGAKIEMKTEKMQEVIEIYKQSQRTLVTLNMQSEIKASYGAASGSLAVSAGYENEIQQSLENDTKASLNQTISQNFTLEENQDYGTVIWSVDIQVGGYLIRVPISHETGLWEARNTKDCLNHYATKPMKNLLERCGHDTSTLPEETKTFLIQPLVGKTCHHVKFREVFSDGCQPDGSNCVELYGKHFVVCHHNDFQYIGGAGCDCTHIDNVNVILRPAHELSDKYPA